MSSSSDHRSVAQALYQLDFYLHTIQAPFSIKDLYRGAYEERRGERYDDAWLDHLEDDPHIPDCLEQPFTAHTIVETLLQTGHEAILRQLIKRIRKEGIGFTQAYISGAGRRRP